MIDPCTEDGIDPCDNGSYKDDHIRKPDTEDQGEGIDHQDSDEHGEVP